VTFPVVASPKLDGVRCLIIDGVAYSRELKKIPNKFVQSVASGMLHNLDGELMIEGADFNAVQSGVMSIHGKPDFSYWAFDLILYDRSIPYVERVALLSCLVGKYSRMRVTPTAVVHNHDQLSSLLALYERSGYEGLMHRQPHSPYKHGRSTASEGYLVKMKTFHDAEAVLVEFTEKMHNTNEAKKDKLGKTKRSTKKSGMVPAGTAGAAILTWNGHNFKVGFGPGITDDVKKAWWENRETLKGSTVTFSYQELSKYGVPRFGKLLGFRLDVSGVAWRNDHYESPTSND
jgi:DNA ligase-1